MPLRNLIHENPVIKDALRFVTAGLINTGFTYITFLLATAAMSYEYAYALSWVAGIIFVLVLYPSKVFVGSKSSPKKLVMIFVQYGAIFLFGLLCMRFLVDSARINQKFAIIIVIVITTIANFLLMRFVLRKIDI
jgi:putative flippase GtrA